MRDMRALVWGGFLLGMVASIETAWPAEPQDDTATEEGYSDLSGIEKATRMEPLPKIDDPIAQETFRKLKIADQFTEARAYRTKLVNAVQQLRTQIQTADEQLKLNSESRKQWQGRYIEELEPKGRLTERQTRAKLDLDNVQKEISGLAPTAPAALKSELESKRRSIDNYFREFSLLRYSHL
jgi:hypothetical protein